MSRVNVNDASREELVTIVKQLLRRSANPERIQELEQQVRGLKQTLEEKEDLVRALTHQNAVLFKKSAGDEETITVLINQLENVGTRETNMTSDNSVVEATAVLSLATPSSTNEKIRGGVKTQQTFGKNSNGGASDVTGSIQGECATVSNAAAIIAQKNEEIVKLETKVRELTEVNTFYTLIVSNHDEEERCKKAKESSPRTEDSSNMASTDVTSFHERISILESERDVLQRMLRHQDQEKRALAKELQNLRQELTRLELDLVAVERWRVAAVASLNPSERSPRASTLSSGQDEGFAPLRTMAEVLTPIRFKRSGSKFVSNATNRDRSVTSLEEIRSRPHGLAISRSLPQLDALPELCLSNLSKQEKSLWERAELYRKYIEEMQAYEMDRQRSFDEIERTRAELFTDMNAKLEEQRREIQRLNRLLVTSVDVCCSNDVKNNMAHRLVKDAATSPIFCCLSREQEEAQFFEAFSLVTAEATSATNVDLILADAAREMEKQSDHADADDGNENEKTLYEILGPVSVSEDHSSVLLVKKEDDDTFGRNYQNVSKWCSSLKTGQASQPETRLSIVDIANWKWQLFEVAEENERLCITCEETDEVVQMLLQIRLNTALLVKESFTHTAAAVKKAEDLQNILTEMQTRVCLLEERERELVEEVARLKKEISLMTVTKEDYDDLIASCEIFTASTLDAACTREPMRCVVKAYSEVVDTQIALLRIISTSVTPLPLGSDVGCISKELDAIIAGQSYLSSGNCEKGEKDLRSCIDGLGRDVVEKATVSVEDTSSPKRKSVSSFPVLTVKHATSISPSSSPAFFTEEGRGAVTTSKASPCEAPSGQNADAPNEKSEHLSDTCCHAISSSVKEKNKAGKSVTERTSPADSSLPGTPTISTVLYENLFATSNGMPLPGAQVSQIYTPDPLDYFMTSRQACEKTEWRGEVQEKLPSEKNIVSFFTVAQPEESSLKQEEETKTFVAEFDPFA